MKIGLIGAGIIGQLRAQSVRNNPETELLGVVDTVPANAERAVAGSSAKALGDVRALLDLPGLDAVIISSPVHVHEEQVLATLKAGKHVLCEKPLANSQEACWRLLEAAELAGKTLAVGFNHRYYPSIKYVKHVIDSGQLGTIDHFRVFGGHDGLANFRADWQYKMPLSGGGAMMDVGIHMTDLTRFLAGDITQVFGTATGGIWKVSGSEDNAMALFKTVSGVPVIYQATWTEWKGYRFYVEAYGDRGMVRGYYAPMFNLLVTSDKPGGARKKSYKFYPEIIFREKLKGWTSTALFSFEDELRDFLRLTRGEVVPLADAFDGFRAVEVAQAVYQSTKSGQSVTLRSR